MFIARTQVAIVPIAEPHVAYARESDIDGPGADYEIDKNESLNNGSVRRKRAGSDDHRWAMRR